MYDVKSIIMPNSLVLVTTAMGNVNFRFAVLWGPCLLVQCLFWSLRIPKSSGTSAL